MKPGTITFRTTPADPDAANRPKVAIGPGRYTLDKNVRLIVVGKPVAGRRTSDVEIRFWAADPKAEPPGKPYKIQVPDGFGTWAITCRPGTGILWVLTSGAVRKIDYSNPAQVKETSITRGSSDDMPDEFREAVKRILTISNVPAEKIKALIAGSAPDESEPKGTESGTGPTVFGSIIARWAAKILRGLRVGRRREKCDVNVAGTCHVGSGDAATGEAKAMRCDRDVTRQPVAA